MTNYFFDTYVQYFINIFTLLLSNGLTFEISVKTKNAQKILFSQIIFEETEKLWLLLISTGCETPFYKTGKDAVCKRRA